MIEVFKEFKFEAAHKLPNVPEGHKCARLHGHSFVVQVYVTGVMSEEKGWIVDFADIKKCWKAIEPLLDHNYLNDVEGLENPTSEVIARWIWRKLSQPIRMIDPTNAARSKLTKIVVKETCSSGAVFTGAS